MVILFVNRNGIASTLKPFPAGRINLGVQSALILGIRLEGFVNLGAAQHLAAIIWEMTAARYQQRQIESRC